MKVSEIIDYTDALSIYKAGGIFYVSPCSAKMAAVNRAVTEKESIVTGILSQLGFIPPSLKYDALGLSRHTSEKHVKEQYVIQNKTTFIRNSDAHYPEQIGEIYSILTMEEKSFSEIKKALNQEDNRYCELP